MMMMIIRLLPSSVHGLHFFPHFSSSQQARLVELPSCPLDWLTKLRSCPNSTARHRVCLSVRSSAKKKSSSSNKHVETHEQPKKTYWQNVHERSISWVWLSWFWRSTNAGEEGGQHTVAGRRYETCPFKPFESVHTVIGRLEHAKDAQINSLHLSYFNTKTRQNSRSFDKTSHAPSLVKGEKRCVVAWDAAEMISGLFGPLKIWLGRIVTFLLSPTAEGDASLDELARLPAGCKIVARGRCLEELQTLQDQLSTVNVVRYWLKIAPQS